MSWLPYSGCACSKELAQLNTQNVAILAALKTLFIQGAQMAVNLTALTASVAKNNDVEQSAIVAFAGINTKLTDISAQLAKAIAANDPAAAQAAQDSIDGLSASITTNSAALAAAVAANIAPAGDPPPSNQPPAA